MSEPELIRGVRQGDETAWSTLMHTHQEAVFRLAYLLLGDSAEAEDVAQETFLRAYQAMHRFDQERPLRPWLLQIAKNLAYNRKRSLRRYLAALQRWLTAVPQAKHESDERNEPDAIALHAAVARLAQADQEVIYLRYFLDLSVAETAQVLGVATGTVKSRLARALGRLRPLVTDETGAWQKGATP